MSWKDTSTDFKYYDFLLTDLEVNPVLDTAEFVLSPSKAYESFAWKEVDTSPGVGDISPNWQVKNEKGQIVQLADFKDKIVVLTFWNTWCGICRRTLPQVQNVAHQFSPKQLVVLGLNVFEWRERNPTAYWAKENYSFPYFLEADEIAYLYAIPSQPAFIVIGKNRQILFNQWGSSGDLEQKLRSIIQSNI